MIKSIIIISIIGTISHFLYDLTNHNKIVGLFTSVNESTWEHIKISLTPTILYSLYDGYLYGANPNYFFVFFFNFISLIILIPLLFYTYKNIFKKDNKFFNIAIFYISIIISQILFYVILDIPKMDYIYNYLSCIGIFIIFGCYLLLTLLPLKTFLFKDPITNKYGYKAHK